jgi:hypothetical protein
MLQGRKADWIEYRNIPAATQTPPDPPSCNEVMNNPFALEDPEWKSTYAPIKGLPDLDLTKQIPGPCPLSILYNHR